MCACVHACVRVCVFVCAYVSVCGVGACVCACVCVCICECVWGGCVCTGLSGGYNWVNTHMQHSYICMNTCVNLNGHILILWYVCTHLSLTRCKQCGNVLDICVRNLGLSRSFMPILAQLRHA